MTLINEFVYGLQAAVVGRFWRVFYCRGIGWRNWNDWRSSSRCRRRCCHRRRCCRRAAGWRRRAGRPVRYRPILWAGRVDWRCRGRRRGRAGRRPATAGASRGCVGWWGRPADRHTPSSAAEGKSLGSSVSPACTFNSSSLIQLIYNYKNKISWSTILFQCLIFLKFVIIFVRLGQLRPVGANCGPPRHLCAQLSSW